MAEKKKEVLKGILMGLSEFAQNEADKIKWKSKLALTEQSQRKNWLWQLQTKRKEDLKQKKIQNKMTEMMIGRMNKNQGGGMGLNFGPEARIGTGGKTEVHYPSTKEKEFMIKQGLNRIRLKEQKNMALTPREQQFKEQYSGMYDKVEDPHGLSSEQQVQARALSRRLYGVRGAQFGLPTIYEEMRKGKSIKPQLL